MYFLLLITTVAALCEDQTKRTCTTPCHWYEPDAVCITERAFDVCVAYNRLPDEINFLTPQQICSACSGDADWTWSQPTQKCGPLGKKVKTNVCPPPVVCLGLDKPSCPSRLGCHFQLGDCENYLPAFLCIGYAYIDELNNCETCQFNSGCI